MLRTKIFLVSYKLCLLIPTLFFHSLAFALKVNLSDFNIKASNKNNTEGFLKLSEWLKGKSNIEITFPKGTYYVGQQKPSTTHVVENIDNLFILKNCSNVKIIGNNATIKYIDGLMFGAFDIKTKQKIENKSIPVNFPNAAFPGDCILIWNSKNISISNLTLDGNNIHLILGGVYGDVGIQASHRGVFIVDSYNVELKNMFIHHFGLDGIEISNKITNTGTSNYQVQIRNIKSTYNGRQGISWTGGNGLYIENSEFSHTGKGKVSSPPGAGIDIEPEVGKCSNGYFKNCKFENNDGYAFGSDYFSLPIENILFYNCTFGGTTNGALFPSNGGVTIDRSIIYGQIVRPSGISVNQRVVIKNSTLYDYNPKNLSNLKYASNHLIDAGSHRSYFDFSNCKIYLKKVKLCFIETSLSDSKLFPTFKNNKVFFNYEGFAKNDFIALFRGCIVENNTFEVNSKNALPNGNFLLSQGTLNIGENTIIDKNNFIGWNSATGSKKLPATIK